MSDGSFFTKEVIMAVSVGVVAVWYLWNKSSNSNDSDHDQPQPVQREKLQRLPVGNLTLEQLSKYKGENNSRLLVSVCGRIFDLTKGRDFYGYPDGPYNCFCGGDASYMLGAMSLTVTDKNKKDFEQDGDHQITLSDWVSRYRSKYPTVGYCVEFIKLCPDSWREAGNDDVIEDKIDFNSDKFKLITMNELSDCTKMDNNNSWISICGFVFNVSAAEIVYESMYGDFPNAIGHDISVSLLNNKWHPDTTYDITIDDEIKNNTESVNKLKMYLKLFSESYPIIGKLNSNKYSLNEADLSEFSDDWNMIEKENKTNDNAPDVEQKTNNETTENE